MSFSIVFRRIVLSSFALFFFTTAALAIGQRPLRVELEIDPGSSQTAEIRVINDEDQPITAQPILQAHAGNNEAGYPLDEQLAEDDPRNILSWVSFSEKKVSVPANSEKTVELTVRVPAGAEPGGRYASVVYLPVVEGDGNVQLRTSVASLLLIAVGGQQERSAELTSFDISDQLYSDRGVLFQVGYENTGNIHLKPEGEIRLKNAAGEYLTAISRYLDFETRQEILTGSIDINPTRGNVLPGSERVFQPSWDENIVLEEVVTAELTLVKPGGGEVTASTTFEIFESLKVRNFDLSGDTFELSIENTGDVYEKLIGKILIVNEFDFVQDEITIPTETDYIAPGDTKNFEIVWEKAEMAQGNLWAKLDSHLGLSGEPVEAKIRISGGSNLIWILLIVLVIGAAAGGGFYFLRIKKLTENAN